MISSANVTSFILSLGGVAMSEVYRLNSVGEGTPSILISACFDFVLLYIVGMLVCVLSCRRLYHLV